MRWAFLGIKINRKGIAANYMKLLSLFLVSSCLQTQTQTQTQSDRASAMGPKKKDAMSSAKQKKKGSSDSGASARPAKGGAAAAKVTISAENEQRLRRLLLQNNVAVSRSTDDDNQQQTQEALSDSQKKQASRRLRSIYDNLASEGFTNSQIELALSAVALVFSFVFLFFGKLGNTPELVFITPNAPPLVNPHMRGGDGLDHIFYQIVHIFA